MIKVVLVTYAERDGAIKRIDCDAVVREGWDSDAEVTESPIERGAEVVDHVREKNDALTLEILITNTPTRVPQSHMSGVGGTTTKDEAGTVLVFDGEFDRVRNVAQDLVRVKAAGLLWYIQTALNDYDEYLLQNFKATKEARTGNSATFILTLKRARFVDTNDTSIPRTRRAAPRVNAGAQQTERPPQSFVNAATGTAAATLGDQLRRSPFGSILQF